MLKWPSQRTTPTITKVYFWKEKNRKKVSSSFYLNFRQKEPQKWYPQTKEQPLPIIGRSNWNSQPTAMQMVLITYFCFIRLTQSSFVTWDSPRNTTRLLREPVKPQSLNQQLPSQPHQLLRPHQQPSKLQRSKTCQSYYLLSVLIRFCIFYLIYR